jgi:hypothetical protein
LTEATGAALSDVLQKLAAGDMVTPVETLRKETIGVLGRLRGIDPVGKSANRISEMHMELEPYMARVIPLADHGGERGLEVVLSEITLIAAETGRLSIQPNADPLEEMFLHDAIWSLMAYALSHDRTDILACLSGVKIPSRHPEDTIAVFESVPLRYNDLLEGDAFKTYDSFRDWLVQSELRGLIPRWQRDTDLNAAIEEAELWAVLRFAQSRGEVWTPLAGADSQATPRLRLRFRDPAACSNLASFFGVGGDEDEVADALNIAYARLKGRNSWPMRGQLIPVEPH